MARQRFRRAHLDPRVNPDRQAGNQADLPRHPQLRKEWPKCSEVVCRSQSVCHDVRGAVPRLSICNCMEPAGYTEIGALPQLQRNVDTNIVKHLAPAIPLMTSDGSR